MLAHVIHCALHAWVRIPSSSGRALKGLCCLSQTSIVGEAILGTTSPVSTSLPSLSGWLAVFPYGSIVHPLCDEVAEWLRRWTANPLCSARVGSNPILVVKGPQGLVLCFSNEHTRQFYGLHHQCTAPSLPYLPFLAVLLS